MPAGKNSYASPHMPQTTAPETQGGGGKDGHAEPATKTPMKMRSKGEVMSASPHIPEDRPVETAMKKG